MGSSRRRVPGLLRVAAIGVALALALPAVPSQAIAASPIFGPYQATSVGSWPKAVAIGDVTGDGLPDVVMTTWYNNDPAHDYRLWVFAQTAGGLLASPVSYATAATYQNEPDSVAVGDVTGDGRADVVLGLSHLGIQVFPQLASGLLGPPTLIPTVDSLIVKLGHLGGQGALDIAGIGWGTNTVSVFLNDGSGGFGAPAVYSALHGGYDDLQVGDVTGDGLDDLVVMSGQLYADPNISVLPRLPGGGFGAAATYSVGVNVLTQGIAVGDVTGDGRNDVVATYGGNRPAASIAVFAQTGSGTLAAPVRYASYDIPEPVAIADVDGDGRADVVTLHGGWLEAGVYRSQADGTLAAEELSAIPYATHYGPGGLAVGDFTGDGWRDVAIADYNHGLVVLRNARPPEPPSAPQALATSPNLPAGVGLTWQPPQSSGTAQVTGYRIYRGTASGQETSLVTIGAGPANPSYTDASVALGTTYWYQVSAISSAGEGPRSVEAVAQRGTAPTAPQNLVASAGKSGIGLTWGQPSSSGGPAVTAFRIYRGTSSGAETLLTSVGPSTTAFTDTKVTRRVRYYYRITAVNVLGEGSPSKEVSAVAR